MPSGEFIPRRSRNQSSRHTPCAVTGAVVKRNHSANQRGPWQRRAIHVALCLWASLAAASVGLGQVERERAGAKDDKRIVRISGEVRDAANRPVADATVWLVGSDGRGNGSPEPLSEGHSGAEGEFSFFEAVEKYTILSLIARDSRGRLGWNFNSVHPGVNQVRLRDVRDARGRVVDGDGQPIAGARVTPRSFLGLASDQPASAGSVELFAELGGSFEGRTDKDGVFVLHRIPEQVRVRGEISAPGFGQGEAYLDFKAPVVVKLERPGTIAGALAPLEGVEAAKGGYKLRLSRQGKEVEPGNVQPLVVSHSEEVTTNDDGAFRSGELPPGRYAIVAVEGQGRPFFAHPRTYVEVKPGQKMEGVSVPLAPTVRLTGRVVDRETGKGIEGVEVLGSQSPRGPDRDRSDVRQTATTDAEGRFELRLPPGSTHVFVYDAPRTFLVPPSDIPNSNARTIADGEEWPTFELAHAAQVEGIVVDATRQPAPHAELHIDLYRRSSRPYDWLPSVSDGDGKFAISQVDPEMRFSLRARTPEAVTDGVVLVTASELKGPAKLAVSKKHVFRLRGKVVDETGLTVPQATVSIEWERPVYGIVRNRLRPLPNGFAPQFRGYTRRRTEFEQLATDADGKFESSVLWPGDNYQAIVAAPGYANLETSIIQGVAGSVHDFGELVLKRNDLVVSGIVVDEEGRAVADAEVQVVTPGRPFRAPQHSDAQGRFAIADIDASVPLALRARTAAAATGGATVVLPADFDKPVKLVVSAKYAFRFRGAVVDRQGKPAPSASVSIVWDRRGPDRQERQRLVAGRPSIPSNGPVTFGQVAARADGVFETPALWPDENYHLVASAPGYAPVESAAVYGPAGETTTLAPLVLTRNDLTIAGRVVDSEGRPLEGAKVFNSGDADKPLVSTTGADGRFALEGLYEGPLYLLARRSGCRAAGWRGAAGGEPVEIALSPSDQPIPRAPIAKSDERARFAAEQELARRLVVDLWALRERFDDNPRAASTSRFRQRRSSSQAETAVRLSKVMARLDLNQALAWSVAEGGRLDEAVRVEAVMGDFKNDVDRALALLRGMKTYAARSALLAMARREIAAGKQEQAIRLLEAALAAAPSESAFVGPDARWQDSDLASARAQVGALAIRAGRVEWGAKLLGQAADSAEKAAPEDAMTRGRVAAALAVLDPERALRLLRTIQNAPGFASYYSYAGHAAAMAGANDWKRAREFLNLLQPGPVADRARTQVACLSADRDWKAALELVDEMSQLDLWTKADALCWVAKALAQRDPDQAYALIDRALDLYFDAPPTAGSVSGGRPVEAARVAMAACDVGYPDVPGVIDRVLALRVTYSGTASTSREIAATINTARVLALVDPAIARELLKSLEPKAPLIGADGDSVRGAVGRGEWLQAWALADLEEARRRCDEELAELKKQSKIETASIALLPLVELLVVPPSERERFMLRSIDPRYWFPGDEEP